MANHIEQLLADLRGLHKSLATCIAAEDSFVRQRREELGNQIEALESLRRDAHAYKVVADSYAPVGEIVQADAHGVFGGYLGQYYGDILMRVLPGLIEDAVRFANLREILVTLNDPNVMNTLGVLIENAADEVAARHPKPTPETINELADVIIRTAVLHSQPQ